MVEIVAEISGNHGGDRDKMVAMILEAANCGCDYAKFQYYKVEDMPDRHEGDNEAMYRKLAVDPSWLPWLFGCARANSIGLFASVFSVDGAKELLQYDMPYIKLAAPESTPLAQEVYQEIGALVAQTTTRLIVSGSLCLFPLPARHGLYCPPGHPQKIGPQEKDVYTFEPCFNGFSDHTKGITDPLWFSDHPKTRMIEKHFRLDDDDKCEDAAFSAEPATMRLLCKLAHNR